MLYILCSFHRGTMANRRYSLNNQSNPSSSTTSSSNSSKTSSPSSPAPAGKGKGVSLPSGTFPHLLLGVSGGWLLARMLLFGGALLPLEIIAILIGAGVSHFTGGNKPLSKLVMGVALLNFFIPGLNPGVKQIREAQLNPPAPIEQVAPPVEEPPPSTERVVVSGKKITLTGDGNYSVPKGRKSLCFTHLGLVDGSTRVPQELTLNGESFSTLGTKCFPLKEELEGNLQVDFFSEQDYGAPEKVKGIYAYWNTQPGGQSEWPVIRLGE